MFEGRFLAQKNKIDAEKVYFIHHSTRVDKGVPGIIGRFLSFFSCSQGYRGNLLTATIDGYPGNFCWTTVNQQFV